MKKGIINVNFAPRNIAYMGEEKIVGQADRYSTIPYKDIVAYAAKAAHVPESSIEMAMESLYDAFNYFVMNGHSVQIPNLGTFSLRVSVKTTASEADFTNRFASNYRGAHIVFQPCSELKQEIASTSITTTAQQDSAYESTAVLAVTGLRVQIGNAIMNAAAGAAIPAKVVKRIIFTGSRLYKKYLGLMTIAYLKADGSTVTQNISTASSYDFASARYTLDVPADCVALKSVTLKDAEGNNLMERTFLDTVPAEPKAGILVIDGTQVERGGTYKATGSTLQLTLYGLNFSKLDTVMVGSIETSMKSGNDTCVTVELATPQASGNYPITLLHDETVTDTFNFSIGQASGRIISSMTANGDPLLNGSTTNITAGQNYNVAISGSGLEGLSADDFTLPAGTTVTIGSVSNTQAQVVINNAQAGALVIKDEEGNSVFTANLVAVTTEIQVTGYKNSLSGSVRELSTSYTCDQDNGFEIYLVGQNLDDLTQASFSGTGISGITYDAESALVAGTKDGSTRTLVITAGGTTIGSITLVSQSGGGNDDDDDGAQ